MVAIVRRAPQPTRLGRLCRVVAAVGLSTLSSVVAGHSARSAAADPIAAGSGRDRVVVGVNVPATAIDLGHPRSQNSPALATDPTDGRFVALAFRIDGPTEFGCGLDVSGDGGQSWVPVNPLPELPPGVERCYAPEIDFNRDGRLYYLFVGLAGPGNLPVGAFLTYSDDRGRSFAQPWRVLDALKYSVRMAIDRDWGRQGRIHLVWLAPSASPSPGALPLSRNPIVASHSDDGGRSLSKPVQVSDVQRSLVVAPALALGARHTVHVAYYDLQDDRRDYQGLEGPAWEGNWSIVIATSSDGGERFSEGVLIDDAIVPPERVILIFTMAPPSLSAGKGGALYVAWWDRRNGDWDVFLSRSTNAGRSWTSATRVNDDPVGNGRHQYMPRLSVAQGGRLDIIYYDRRDDPFNARNDVSYSYSRDRGRTFAPTQRITSQSFFSDTGSSYGVTSAEGLIEFGSRIGLVSTGSGALAAWTDTRLLIRNYEHQDVFSAEVRLVGSRAANGKGMLLRMATLGAVFLLFVRLSVIRSRRHP